LQDDPEGPPAGLPSDPPEEPAEPVYAEVPAADPALLPSNLYTNIVLDQQYFGDLPGFDPEDAGNKPDWYYDFYPETVNNLTEAQVNQVWKYYSIDVASQLGGELRVTDPEHALNAMDTDLKFENVD
jgi:hypothetical protein